MSSKKNRVRRIKAPGSQAPTPEVDNTLYDPSQISQVAREISQDSQPFTLDPESVGLSSTEAIHVVRSATSEVQHNYSDASILDRLKQTPIVRSLDTKKETVVSTLLGVALVGGIIASVSVSEDSPENLAQDYVRIDEIVSDIHEDSYPDLTNIYEGLGWRDSHVSRFEETREADVAYRTGIERISIIRTELKDVDLSESATKELEDLIQRFRNSRDAATTGNTSRFDLLDEQLEEIEVFNTLLQNSYDIHATGYEDNVTAGARGISVHERRLLYTHPVTKEQLKINLYGDRKNTWKRKLDGGNSYMCTKNVGETLAECIDQNIYLR